MDLTLARYSFVHNYIHNLGKYWSSQQDLKTKFCGAFDCEATTRQAAGGAKPAKR